MMIKDVLRNEHGSWVGNFYCDDNSWIIYSDYGTYAHTFYYSSGTLKQFLTHCNSDYLCRKLLPIEEQEEIDWELSKKQIMKSILEGRRNDCYESNRARILYDAIKYCYDIEDFYFSEEEVRKWVERKIERTIERFNIIDMNSVFGKTDKKDNKIIIEKLGGQNESKS